MKIVKAQVMVTHNRKEGICQISIREVEGNLFVVVSDYVERKRVIFKECKTLLEAGMEYKALIKKVESKGYRALPVDGITFDFSADTFDFAKFCYKKYPEIPE